MIKAVSLSLGFAFLLVATTLPAQTGSTDVAVNEAVLRQANTILLRQKLLEARNAQMRGEISDAAKFYDEADQLVAKIGPISITNEVALTVAGVASTRLTLARQDQNQGDLRGAATQVNRVLKVDPQNSAALAFKKNNDALLTSMRGQMPDQQTLDQVPYINNDKTDAGTLVRDGKLFYEMGKLDEAEVKLKEAVRLDPDSEGAFYYLNLVKQARYDRESKIHTIDTKERMVQVEKAYERPVNRGLLLPVPNPYAMTNLVHTGAGREAIYSKLDRIRLDTVSWPEGLPLSEVLRNLSDQTKLRDPDKKGINFLFNPNAPAASAPAAPAGGAQTIDPTTGLPVAAPAAAGESVDASSINIKLTLNDVRLADVLEAIILVADHPIKYSLEDYGIVFSSKGPEQAQLETRTFKVDPNTFYQGLESVSAASFGSANTQSSGSGGGGGGGGGGGSGQTQTGAAVAIVNAFPGAGSARSSGGGQGGGGGGGGGAGGATGNGGLAFVTTTNLTANISLAAKQFFTTLGLTLDPPKSVFFNDRLGVLFVHATPQDLDTIEKAIQVLNMTPPQIHIKARFIEVEQDDAAALGFDWYLGQFNMGGNRVVGQAGTAPSLNVPNSPGSGAFPGQTPANLIPGSTGDQLLTGGLRTGTTPGGAAVPALGTITGILTDPNFRLVIHALEQRTGFESLAEPEVTTTSGRQTQMRATDILTIITSFSFQQNVGGGVTTGTTQ